MSEVLVIYLKEENYPKAGLRNVAYSTVQCTVKRLLYSYELHRNVHTIFPSRNLNLEVGNSFFDHYDINEKQLSLAMTSGRPTSLEFTIGNIISGQVDFFATSKTSV